MMQGSDLLIESDDDSKLLDDIDQELTDFPTDTQRSGMEEGEGGDWGPGITHAYPRHNIEGIPLLSDDSHFEDDNDDDDDDLTNHSSSGGSRNGSRNPREYTVEEAVEACGFGAFQLRIFLVCGLFSATDALEMLLLSVLSPELRCEWLLPEYKVALITTVVFIGMFSGSNIWGIGADKYGRLAIMKLAAVWIAYFGILCAFSPNYYWMLILRGLVGMGFGGAVQSWAYKSEYFPSKYRGQALSLSKIMWAMGSTFEVGLTRIVIAEYDMGWRWLVALSAFPMVITIFFIWRLPESARYLVAAGRGDEALTVLREAAAMNKTRLPPGRLVQSKQEARGKLSDLFSPGLRRTTLQLWLLWLGTAGSYYGIVLAQSEILEFHKSCGTEPSLEESPLHESCHCNKLSVADYNSMIYATLGEFVAIPLNMLTIDTLGRRITLALDFLFAGVFFLLMLLCTSRAWLTVFIFGVRAFTAGIFNTVYIYTSEVYPTTTRSLGLGTCSACARIGAMVTPFIAQVMLKSSLSMSLWLYGLFCIACAATALLLPIETKGRAMQQTAT